MARPPYVVEFMEAKHAFERVRAITADLTVSQTETMLVITMHSGLLSGSEIAKSISKDKGETSKILSHLEFERGWIVTTTDSADRRRKLYWLTIPGRIAAREIFERVTGKDAKGAIDRVPVASESAR